MGRSTSTKKCETVVGCGVSCLQNDFFFFKKCCLGNFGDHPKKNKIPASGVDSGEQKVTRYTAWSKVSHGEKKTSCEQRSKHYCVGHERRTLGDDFAESCVGGGSICPSSENIDL